MRTSSKRVHDTPPPERSASALTAALAEPFDPSEVKFKPAVVSGHRALALAYVDARAIQDRLDEVLGVDGWQDDYETLPDGSVVCRLRLWLGDQWITKVDVGGPSEQPDGGDRIKAAFSDALKRAAVKFGIGRYLYRLPAQWLDYDPARRQFARTPTLPDWALPKGDRPALPMPQPRPPRRPAAQSGTHRMPATGAELERRLAEYEVRLVDEGRCQPGELLAHVISVGADAGYPAELSEWSGPALQLAVRAVKSFEAQLPAEGTEAKEVA